MDLHKIIFAFKKNIEFSHKQRSFVPTAIRVRMSFGTFQPDLGLPTGPGTNLNLQLQPVFRLCRSLSYKAWITGKTKHKASSTIKGHLRTRQINQIKHQFLLKRENRSNWKKTSKSRVENQQTPTTFSRRQAWELNMGHIGEKQVLSPLRQLFFPTIKREKRLTGLDKLVQ